MDGISEVPESPRSLHPTSGWPAAFCPAHGAGVRTLLTGLSRVSASGAPVPACRRSRRSQIRVLVDVEEGMRAFRAV